MSKKKPTPQPEPTPGPQRKPLLFLADIEAPPLRRGIRREAGVQLSRIQDGEKLPFPTSRPMPTIGAGVHELRLHDSSGIYRLPYRVGGDHVLLIDAFKKTSEKTEDKDLNRSRDRLKAFDAEVARQLKAARADARKAPPKQKDG